MPGFSQVPPPKIYRPVQEDGPVAAVRRKMNDLVEEGILEKAIGQYRLDTVYQREMRVVSVLGEAAVAKFTNAVTVLAPDSFITGIEVPVLSVESDVKEVGSRRIIMNIEESEELLEERARVLRLAARMTGEVIPQINFGRRITLGKIASRINRDAVDARLEDIAIDSVTLLPTRIKTK